MANDGRVCTWQYGDRCINQRRIGDISYCTKNAKCDYRIKNTEDLKKEAKDGRKEGE